MTPFLRKSFKIYLIFSTSLHKTWVQSLFYIASVFCVLCLLLFFFLREYLKRIVEVFFCQNMSKLSLIHSTQKAGPNTEIYGPRSEYGFLRTARRPIRMQDSSKPYNNYIYFFICACLLIFFDFLQSDWLQQRAAFYDILTVVQKCYFFNTDQGVELIVELE